MWRANVIGALAMLLISLVSSNLGAQELSDPTAPPQVIERGDTPVNPATNLKLQSIQWKGTQRSAQINGERKYQGDSINQFVLEQIDMHQVVLRHANTNERLTLRLFGFSRTLSNQSPGSFL